MSDTTTVELERWRSTTASSVGIVRWNKRLETEEFQRIERGVEFAISYDERKLNQGKVIRAEHDPFTNGSFAPVHLPDGTPDKTDLEKAVDTMTDEELDALINAPQRVFDRDLAKLSSPMALHRLYTMARAQEAGPKRLTAIRDALKVADPNPLVGDDAGGHPDDNEAPMDRRPTNVEGASRVRDYPHLKDI